MEKNYWLALVLSMLVLMGYPLLIQRLLPKKPPPLAEQREAFPLPFEVKPAPPLAKAEGPFLEKPVMPAVVRFENNLYEIDFSTYGATIARLFYKGEKDLQTTTKNLFYERDPAETGLFGIRFLNHELDLTRTVFKLNRQRNRDQEILEFSYEKQGEFRLIKRYSVENERPAIRLQIKIENLSARERYFPVNLFFGMEVRSGDDVTAHSYEIIALTDSVQAAPLHKIAKKGFSLSKEIVWAGTAKKYFAILIKPDWKALGIDARADDKHMEADLRLEPLAIPPAGSATHDFLVFAGPQRYEALKSFDLGFENILFRGFLGFFMIWLLRALKFCYGFTHNYGWAVILLTLLLKVIFTPLTHISFENMKKMQALQPKLKSLQERYKNDAAKLNREMMELYRRNRVNPMLGCLPMVLQIPIFVSFYNVLNAAIELKGAPFIFWIHDLSEPDRLINFHHTLPFIGDGFHLLPFFMIGSMFWQQKLTPQAGATPEQTKMMNFMPIIFGFLFYKMPSGLVLYWFVNNVLSIIHQVVIKRMVVVLHHEDHQP